MESLHTCFRWCDCTRSRARALLRREITLLWYSSQSQLRSNSATGFCHVLCRPFSFGELKHFLLDFRDVHLLNLSLRDQPRNDELLRIGRVHLVSSVLPTSRVLTLSPVPQRSPSPRARRSILL